MSHSPIFSDRVERIREVTAVNEELTAEAIQDAHATVRETIETNDYVAVGDDSNIRLDDDDDDNTIVIDARGVNMWGNPVVFGRDSKMYNGCEECWGFSMLFGGHHNGRMLRTEEDFEKAKEEFVIHFNEKHKDIIMKRRAMPKKKHNFTKKSNGKHQGSFYDGLLMVDVGFFSSQPHAWVSHIGSAVEPRSAQRRRNRTNNRVNRNNLDRNARFRANLADPPKQQDNHVQLFNTQRWLNDVVSIMEHEELHSAFNREYTGDFTVE